MSNGLLLDTILELVEESPDNVYLPGLADERCFYISGECSNGSIGCIVGQALRKMGYDANLMDEEITIPELLKNLGIENTYDTKQINWMIALQLGQDMGYTWQEAMDRADFGNER